MKINRYKYRTWIDKYFDYFTNLKIHYSICVLITAITIFLIGLFFSIMGNFIRLYLNTIHIYLVLFGILWVMSWYRWGYLKFFQIVKNLLSFIDLQKKQSVGKKLQNKMEIATNSKYVIISSSVLAILFYLSLFFWFTKFYSIYKLNFLNPILPDAWFIGPTLTLLLKIATLFIYASFIALLVGTIGYEIVIFDIFIIRLLYRNIDPKKYLSLRYKLHEITNYNLKITFSWSIGVAICILGVINKNSPLIWCHIGIFSFISILSFLLPQYILHISLKKLKFNVLYELSRRLNCLVFNEQHNSILPSKNYSNIANYYSLVYGSSTYFAGLSVIPKLLITSILPQLISLYIKNKYNF